MTRAGTESDSAETERPGASGPHVALVGATITGNRGAESMLRAAVQRIPEFAAGARFTLLSVYPADDVAENHDPRLRIVAFSPLHMVFVAFPLAMLAGAAKRLRLPYRWVLPASLRAIDDADVLVDLSGISFVDGRGAIIIYNCLLVLLPVLLRTPVLKYSQALGPFRNPLNRRCAGWLLPKVHRIAARGRVTREHLDELGLPAERLRDCADAAFAMQVGSEAEGRIAPLLASPLFERPVVTVSASSVVDKLCQKRGLDYAGRMVGLIRWLIHEKGYRVALLAHSARPGRESTKNNDIPVCRRIAEAVGDPGCVLVDPGLNAEAQRALIGRSRFLVAARFHAMISGLATGVPTMQVGWSHKYAEVLEVFELDDFALDYARLTDADLRALFERLEREEATVRERIARHLPAVEQSSLDNARLAAELLAGDARPVVAAPAVAR